MPHPAAALSLSVRSGPRQRGWCLAAPHRPALLVAGLLAGSATLAAPALASLTICNQTPETRSVAIGYPRGSDWVSEGWWVLEQGDCATVIQDALQSRYYYYRSETDSGAAAGEGYFFCTTPEPFAIVGDTRCRERGYASEDFRQIDTGETARDFTVHMTPATGAAPPSPLGSPVPGAAPSSPFDSPAPVAPPSRSGGGGPDINSVIGINGPTGIVRQTPPTAAPPPAPTAPAAPPPGAPSPGARPPSVSPPFSPSSPFSPSLPSHSISTDGSGAPPGSGRTGGSAALPPQPASPDAAPPGTHGEPLMVSGVFRGCGVTDHTVVCRVTTPAGWSYAIRADGRTPAALIAQMLVMPDPTPVSLAGDLVSEGEGTAEVAAHSLTATNPDAAPLERIRAGLVGAWRSRDDPASVLRFTEDGRHLAYYQGTLTEEGRYTLAAACPGTPAGDGPVVILSIPGESTPLCQAVTASSGLALSLLALPRGNSLRYAWDAP